MKGIIFSLLEDVVTTHFDADAWDDMVDASAVSGSYSAIGSYGDAEFVSLLQQLPAGAGENNQARLRWFGQRAMARLAERYSVFFEGHITTLTFLPTLNDVIHPEVRKLYPGADVPVFGFEDGDDGAMTLTYRSHRRLCALAEGFIAGAAHVFGETASVHQDQCALEGADECRIVCRFTREPVTVRV